MTASAHAAARSTAALALLCTLLAGCGAGAAAVTRPAEPVAEATLSGPTAAAPVPPSTPPSATPAVPVARAVAPMPKSNPVGLVVSAIGVRTGPLLPLGIDRGGALEVPPDATSAGWFRLGPAPGSAGPAVLAAHVDYKGVAGVFSRLKELAPGNEIRVARADGTVAVFTTYRVEHYPKTDFPTAQVYGNTAGPELRLITCGGSFDSSTGQYRDNVVAYARLTGAA